MIITKLEKYFKNSKFYKNYHNIVNVLIKFKNIKEEFKKET
jgi:hypothetical protein